MDWMIIKRNGVFNSMERMFCLLRHQIIYERRPLSPDASDSRVGYFFGGFGGMLFVAAVVSIICYKPLGLPNPDGSNLALGILLFVVICIQGVFNAWQDWVFDQLIF
jgi:hypothetical protein